jgi:hypothetical protein
MEAEIACILLKNITSILRDEHYDKQERSKKQAMLISCLAYSSALKMEAIHSTETLKYFH